MIKLMIKKADDIVSLRDERNSERDDVFRAVPNLSISLNRQNLKRIVYAAGRESTA
jgi:hypothetical protein